MATSIPGGATLAADGETWQDANGKPLKKEQIAAIEELHARRTGERNAAEAARMASEAQGNPIAHALMALLSRQAAPVEQPEQPEQPKRGKG